MNESEQRVTIKYCDESKAIMVQDATSTLMVKCQIDPAFMRLSGIELRKRLGIAAPAHDPIVAQTLNWILGMLRNDTDEDYGQWLWNAATMLLESDYHDRMNSAVVPDRPTAVNVILATDLRQVNAALVGQTPVSVSNFHALQHVGMLGSYFQENPDTPSYILNLYPGQMLPIKTHSPLASRRISPSLCLPTLSTEYATGWRGGHWSPFANKGPLSGGYLPMECM